MTKKLLTVIIFLVVSVSSYASDVQVWHDPSLDLKKLKKIFIMPITSSLDAGNNLIPAKRLSENLYDWALSGINSAVKKGTMTIKSLNSLLDDMKFIYGDEVSSGDLFFKRASEMGYTAFIRVNVSQKFNVEHVPETTRTYTEYREIEKRDSKGRVIETIRIPEEKTEVIPAHDVTYLHTVCRPEIYSVNDYEGDYVGVVNYEIYREYQGGPVMKVVENILTASLKNLFTQKK